MHRNWLILIQFIASPPFLWSVIFIMWCNVIIYNATERETISPDLTSSDITNCLLVQHELDVLDDLRLSLCDTMLLLKWIRRWDWFFRFQSIEWDNGLVFQSDKHQRWAIKIPDLIQSDKSDQIGKSVPILEIVWFKSKHVRLYFNLFLLKFSVWFWLDENDNGKTTCMALSNDICWNVLCCIYRTNSKRCFFCKKTFRCTLFRCLFKLIESNVSDIYAWHTSILDSTVY